MAREDKAEIISEIETALSKSSVAILTEYKGLTGAEMAQLHKKFREQGLEFRVVKNTLARLAAQKSNKEQLSTILKGQTAMLVGYGEISVPARTLSEYIRSSKTALTIKGGILGNRLLTASEVDALATMPSRAVLLGRVVAGMQLPLYIFNSNLNGLLSGFARALQARAKQLEAAPTAQ